MYDGFLYLSMSQSDLGGSVLAALLKCTHKALPVLQHCSMHFKMPLALTVIVKDLTDVCAAWLQLRSDAWGAIP